MNRCNVLGCRKTFSSSFFNGTLFSTSSCKAGVWPKLLASKKYFFELSLSLSRKISPRAYMDKVWPFAAALRRASKVPHELHELSGIMLVLSSGVAIMSVTISRNSVREYARLRQGWRAKRASNTLHSLRLARFSSLCFASLRYASLAHLASRTTPVLTSSLQ